MSAALPVIALNDNGDGVIVVDGKHTAVPLTAPGDLVSFINGTPAIDPQPAGRAEPVCPLFGDCGGCRVQHLAQNTYQAWKVERIVSAFERVGITLDPPTLMRSPFASRRRVTLSSVGKTAGYFARGSHRVVDVADCPALAPPLRAALPTLRALLTRHPKARLTATLCDNGIDVALSAAAPKTRRRKPSHPERLPAVPDEIVRIIENDEIALMRETPLVRLGGVDVPLPPGAFLQATREGEAALVDAVLSATTGAKRVLDAFCGVGTFTLPLSERSAVHAVDADQEAVNALAEAARSAVRRKPVTTDVRDLLRHPLSTREISAFDAVVFDPPRAGADALSRELAQSPVPCVVAVSCEPRTLARDCATLLAGGYKITHAVAVDQFVATAHIECALVLHKG